MTMRDASMNVVWTEQAELQRDIIGDYILGRFGHNAVVKFISKVGQTVDAISQNPHIGQVEPLLAHRSTTYRSIVVSSLSKIVYYASEETVYIVDFWDIRREPESLSSHLR